MCSRLGSRYRLLAARLLCLARGYAKKGKLGKFANHPTPMPTTLSALEVQENAPIVSSYGAHGFTVRGNKLMGSVALLPNGAMFSWKVYCSSAASLEHEKYVYRFVLQVKDPNDITAESLVLFRIVEPRLG